jgi:hypothetical protein
MIRILCERPTSLIRFIEFLLCHGNRPLPAHLGHRSELRSFSPGELN